MIKFFRHIRKNMINEGKTTKYFKYAIGEIVLVVIGILIALNINNWNQQRIQDGEEHHALLNLKQDFEYNYSTLDSIITETEKNKKLQFIILNHTGNKPKPKTENEFNLLLNTTTSLRPFFPRNGYLDDLLNSGKLGIIKNQNLRNKLSSWDPIFDYIKSREATVDDEINNISDMIIKRGSWLNADAVGTTETTKNNPFPKSGFAIDNRDLLNELEFENRTENIIYQNDLLITSQKKGIKIINEIIELIDQELKKKNKS